MNGLELKRLREKRGMTQAEFAKETGIPLGTIGRIESSDKEISKASVVKTITEFFKNDDEVDVVKHMGMDSAPYFVNNYASAGLSHIMDNQRTDSYISVPGVGVDFYINVFGDSMYPKYCSGEIVGVKAVELDMIFFGNAYVVEMEDGEAYIKYIKPGNDKDHWILESENEKYPSKEFHVSKIRKVFLIKSVITRLAL